jgi:hypothetical protein
MVDSTFMTFTTYYDLMDVDFRSLVCEGGGLHPSRCSGTMTHPTTIPDDSLYYSRLLKMSQLTGALRTVVRTFLTYTTLYDFPDVDLPCLVYDGGGPHLSK